MKHRLGLIVIFILFFFTLYLALSPSTLTIAPNINLISMAGKHINPAKLHGKTILVTFWATSCPSCMEEVPDLKKIYADYHKHGFELIAVAMYYDRPDHVNEVVKQNKMPYHIIFDLEKKIMAAFKMKQALTPTSFLISPNGDVVYHKIGKLNSTEIRKKIEGLLKEALNTSSLTYQSLSKQKISFLSCATGNSDLNKVFLTRMKLN